MKPRLLPLSRKQAIALLLAGLGFCSFQPVRVSAQTPPRFEWQYSTPEEQGVDSAPLARMLAQIEREQISIRSFALVRHDKVVAEAYVYPYTADSKHRLYSVSKSFTSALVGIAIDRGFIRDVDERLVDVFQGLATRPVAERMNRMSLWHLLTMSTGHANDSLRRIVQTWDWERTFMELSVEEEPGSRFVYDSGASYMLAAALQRRVGMTAAAFAQQNLFGPLGIADYTWGTSPTNVIAGGWGLSLRTLDMARFGLLYLRKGRWNGRQVVPERWVDESSRRQIDNTTGTWAGFWGAGYGYQFWLNDFGGYRAEGAYAQYIFILPDDDAVAVFTAYLDGGQGLPAELMRQYVLPAMRPGDPLVANPRGCAAVRRAAEVLGTFSPPLGAAVAPSFTSLPENQTAPAGSAATFSAAIAGSPSPTCQWYKNEIPIGGATSASLTIAPLTASDAGDYVVVARNASGSLASPPVSLTVTAAPVIVEQPVPRVVAVDAEAEFRVGAAGGDLRYQWRRNGVAIAEATTDTLRLATVTPSDAGDYSVEVSSPRGSVVSNPARLTVNTADERARLVNLSARAFAGTNDQTLIVGLVIGGVDRSAGLPVLLRGVGPSLAPLGVEACMDDPATVLFVNGAPAASNSDWRGAAALATSGIRVGAYTLPTLSADSVMQRVLKPRDYTMHVLSSLPDRSGIVLAECYDAGGPAAEGGPHLVNLSARARVAAGDETLIGGFVISGKGEQRVLIRGVGPTLSSQHVNGVLADPELYLFSGNTLIAHNDDWAGDPALRAAFTAAGAFDLPADSRDAALLVTLPDGVYGAHLTSKGATGVALIEIYAVP